VLGLVVDQFIVKVFLELRIVDHDFVDGFLILSELVFKELAVFGINASLKLVGLDATVETELEIAEEVGHLTDIRSILNVDAVVFGSLVAYVAQFCISVPLGVTALTEDAVTIKDEPSSVFETVLAPVAMHLELLVHIYTNTQCSHYLTNTLSLVVKNTQQTSKLAFTSEVRVAGDSTRPISTAGDFGVRRETALQNICVDLWRVIIVFFAVDMLSSLLSH
jgi:hypothetical protein